MVQGTRTRPVSDRAKEALFNIIGPEIIGARFLDLFAGTGSVGIEALSRGGAEVVFLEINAMAVKTISLNLERTGLTDAAEVLRRDVFAYLAGPEGEAFDYAYVAPPQYKELWKQAVIAIDSHPRWLNPDAWVIAQIHPREYESLSLANLHEFDQRKYGSTLLIFYEHPGD